MRLVRPALYAVAVVCLLPPTLAAQGGGARLLDITEAVLDRFLTSAAKEQSEGTASRTALEDADARIARFEKCVRDILSLIHI